MGEVIDLECENIIPILASVGIAATKIDMISEVESIKEEIFLIEEK